MEKVRRVLAQLAPRFFRRRRFDGFRLVERMSDVPEHTGAYIYVVRRNGNMLWAILDCPCCTGHRLSVNLRTTERPHWTVIMKGRAITINPSLWYHDQCRSHFFVRNNRVDWV